MVTSCRLYRLMMWRFLDMYYRDLPEIGAIWKNLDRSTVLVRAR